MRIAVNRPRLPPNFAGYEGKDRPRRNIGSLVGGIRIGWLRWNYFWDLLPFMNMLQITEPWRGRGHGRALVQHGEKLMQRNGFTQVLTSTLANENAQHFYRYLGYLDTGALFMPGEATEIILLKDLSRRLGNCYRKQFYFATPLAGKSRLR